ncbi:hypothetical protein Tco_1239675 [Tanacetum coccineum]
MTRIYSAFWGSHKVDVNNDLSKPVTTHYLPKERESAVAKPHHMIAPSSSRYSSNDMVHNHYLEEAKKKTQESDKNSRPRHRSSIEKTSVVHEKTKTPRSCLRWKRTGRILKTVGLRWVPTGKIFESSTTKVNSEPPHSSNTYITNLQECIQTLDSSAGTSINVQEEQTLDLNAGIPFNLKKERIKV